MLERKTEIPLCRGTEGGSSCVDVDLVFIHFQRSPPPLLLSHARCRSGWRRVRRRRRFGAPAS